MGDEGDSGSDEQETSFIWESEEEEEATADSDELRDESAASDEDPTPSPDSESESTESGADGGAGRLWNSYGTGGGDSTAGGDGPAAKAVDSSSPAGETGKEGTAESTEPDTTDGEPDRDSDRVWNRRRSSGGGDGRPDATVGVGSGQTADDDTAEGSAGTGSSFDHLLERSASGGVSESGPMETDIEAFFDDLGEFDRATSGSQVLVISPREHSITDEVCSQFLTAGDVSGRNVMFVTTAEPPAERLRICRNNSEWTGGEVAVIELGDVGGGSPEVDDTVNGHSVVHKRVNSPKNFSKAGLLITQTLKKWSNSSRPTALCFHTLTAISGYVQNEVLFQFLFTLQAKLNSLGVTGHYHMDANRHDQQELNTLKTVFDLVIEVSPDGEIEVE